MPSMPRALCAIPLIFLAFSPARADGDDFLSDHISTLRNAAAVERPAWAKAFEITGRGLRPDEQIPAEKALGARLHLLNNLTVATQMVRVPGRDGSTTGEVSWGYGFEQRASADLTLGLAASGSMDSHASRPTHTVGGSVKMALPLEGLGWTARVALATSATLRAAEAAQASLTPSLSGERIISAVSSPYRARLGVSIGTALSASATPNVTTRLELRITPGAR